MKYRDRTTVLDGGNMNEEELANIIVIKRSGKRVAFDGMKIAVAIKKGFDSIEGKYNEDDINKTYNKVINKIKESNLERIKIEQIQDWIEEQLKAGKYDDVYNSYSKYREKRNQSREIFFEEKRNSTTCSAKTWRLHPCWYNDTKET